MKVEKILIIFAVTVVGFLVTLTAYVTYNPVEGYKKVEPLLPALGKAPSFELTDTNGEKFNSDSLKGKIWVADFFFSSCPGPCPTMGKNMGKIQEAFADNDAVRLVNFSVDPARDTPEALSIYAKKLGADTTRWHMLTGPAGEIGRLVDVEGFKLGDGEAIMNHSTKFVLVDEIGLIRGYYEGIDDAAIASLTADIGKLLNE